MSKIPKPKNKREFIFICRVLSHVYFHRENNSDSKNFDNYNKQKDFMSQIEKNCPFPVGNSVYSA